MVVSMRSRGELSERLATLAGSRSAERFRTEGRLMELTEQELLAENKRRRRHLSSSEIKIIAAFLTCGCFAGVVLMFIAFWMGWVQ